MAHADFTLLRTQKIDSLNLEVQEYEHVKTGAKHYHLDCDNDENVFLVALRTMPMDSTGVAHILEHTALCGSEKYPVRDPFFMMIRRSLNTFMNAFTSSDWTAYPFASKNKKDFNNLLSVYLDAVFFAKLDEQDFLQEGHRLEFAETSDPKSDLQFKGVVYNEMKGAMSSVPSQLWQTLTKHLYPTNTYHFNSGGDPETILDLSYEDLISFYKKHYHPSNAIFMTYGDIPAQEHHNQFADYLNRFEPLGEKITVQDEKRYYAPIRVEESYGFNQTENQTHHVLGWLLGHSANLEEQLEAHFLSSLLLENSSSPLRHVLETTDLGTGPSPLCGLEDTNKEMCFVCGIEGSEAGNRNDVEALVMNTLQEIVEKGVSEEQVESVLHQLELSQREVGGDGYPYGLQIILSAISACTHYSDPVELLNLDPELDRLREKAKQPDFVANLIKEYLLENQHRVTLTFKPDEKLDENKLNAEKQRLEKIKQSLTDSEISKIVADGEALKARQLTKDDESILPKVGLEDVADKLVVPAADSTTNTDLDMSRFTQGTNGVSYHQVIKSLPELSEDELMLLPILTSYLSEVGVAGEDYKQTQHRQSLVVGGISAFSTIRSTLHDANEAIAYWTVSGRALSRNHEPFFKLMNDTLYKANFNDTARIKDLLSQSLSRKEQSITGQGHSMAMGVASSGISSISQLSYKVSGLPSLLRLRSIVKSLDDESSLNKICQSLADLYSKIGKAASQHVLVADQASVQDAESTLARLWSEPKAADVKSFSLDPYAQQVKQAWIIPAQTNFCAKVFPTVNASHDDAPALSILAGVLKNGFLHTAIREQGGAYGGGANQDSGTGAFKFYSYRDPRMSGTYDDFIRCMDWFASENHGYEALEQSILGVISGIDKPSSPAGEAKQAFHNDLQGRTADWRNQFRQRILAVTQQDLERVANTYFKEEKASYGALVHSEMRNEAEKQKFEIIEL